MNAMNNPYTLVFGQPPIEIIHRTAQVERIVSEFNSPRPANYINLITGVRGSGKTVFITQIADTLKTKDNWIVVNLNPQRDMLVSLAAKLDSDKSLHKLFSEAQINLQAFGIGLSIKGVPPISDIEEALKKMLESIKKQKKRVLVTIDEATNSKEMRIFASTYQIFLRERLPIFLIMTGLHKEIDRLRNARGMTFLERAPRTVLLPLNQNQIIENYMHTLQVSQAEASILAQQTKGYSFAFQTIGYFVYENRDNLSKALDDAKEYLYIFAYEKIWSELSARDKQVTLAAAKVPSGEIIKMRNILGYSSNQFNPYRDRLLKAGILVSPRNGILKFALPWFDEYAITRSEQEEY